MVRLPASWPDMIQELAAALRDGDALRERVAKLDAELHEAERTIDRLRSELIVAESRQG